MFNRFLESTPATDSARRPATVIFSIGLHLLVIFVVAVIPLIYTDALPMAEISVLFKESLPPPPPAPRSAVKIVSVKRVVSQIHDGSIVIPDEIPHKIARIVDDSLPPQGSSVDLFGVEGGGPNGKPGGVWRSIFGNQASPPPQPIPQKEETKPPVRVVVGGFVQQANLIYASRPIYPVLAKQARIQGEVVLDAIISKDGTVENLELRSGHPLLVPAAMEAVRQWRYRPTLLNREPVEVMTRITVNFSLQGK